MVSEEERRKKQSETRKRLFREGKLKVWNKGLTKETNNSIKKESIRRKGKNNPNWKGGRIQTKEGYIWIYSPNHPACNSRGYVKEYRLVMEKHLGRYLTGIEEIHHKNEIKEDNRIENLQLFATHGDHQKFHEKIKRKAKE